MRQAIHIFWKDTRYLRVEICLTVILAAALPALWPVAAAYLIARLIHAEAIPGQNQFWITKPYRRSSLITAKLLFIAAFVNTPIFLAQTYQTIHRGFAWSANWPGLIWSQVLLALCFSLPAAALAAITSGMIEFIFLAILALIGAAIWFSAQNFQVMGLTARPLLPSGVEWIPTSLIASLAITAAISVLILQFRWRKTFLSRLLVVATALVGLSVFRYLPPQFALDAETHLTRSLVDLRSISFTYGPESETNPFSDQSGSSHVQFKIPIVVTGLPPDVSIKADSLVGTIQGVGGRTEKVYTNGADTRIDASGNTIIRAVVLLNRSFIKAQGYRPAIFRGFFYFSLFGTPRSQTIPQQVAPLNVLDRFRCSTVDFEHLVEFRCTSAFRWPDQLVYAQIPGKDEAVFSPGISYSPFPAQLSLEPFESHSALGSQGLAPPSPLGPPTAPSVTIIAKRPLAHARTELVAGLRLNEILRRRPPTGSKKTTPGK